MSCSADWLLFRSIINVVQCWIVRWFVVTMLVRWFSLGTLVSVDSIHLYRFSSLPQSLMTDAGSPVVDFYPVTFETDLNGKQQDSEAVVLIPFIDEVNLWSLHVWQVGLWVVKMLSSSSVRVSASYLFIAATPQADTRTCTLTYLKWDVPHVYCS